jgi:hypothetical protein
VKGSGRLLREIAGGSQLWCVVTGPPCRGAGWAVCARFCITCRPDLCANHRTVGRSPIARARVCDGEKYTARTAQSKRNAGMEEDEDEEEESEPHSDNGAKPPPPPYRPTSGCPHARLHTPP